MATSPDTGYRSSESSLRTKLEGVPDLCRYDAVLAAIPLVFALVLSAHALLPVPFRLAIAAGSLLSGLLLLDATYLNPPSHPSERSQ